MAEQSKPLIDTEEFNKGLAEFYSGLAKALGEISKAAEEVNILGEKMNRLCSDVRYAACNVRPSASDPDYMIPDEQYEKDAHDEEAPADTVSAKAPPHKDAATQNAQTAAAVPEAKTASKPEAPSASPSPDVSASPTKLTLDDITKVIVTKIKQNRAVNDKIGELVKAYGYKQIRELPEDKYEAFLNDLAQL